MRLAPWIPIAWLTLVACGGSAAPPFDPAPIDSGATVLEVGADVDTPEVESDAAIAPPPMDPIALPGGDKGIGFDDMRTDPRTGGVLVPGGVTGSVFLIDPATHAVSSFDGFAATPGVTSGHGNGPTSVDVGGGFLFVTDRTSQTLDVVDVTTQEKIASVKLKSGPDYVRFVAETNEVWITEPSRAVIEVFDLAPLMTSKSAPVSKLTIPGAGGPESLVVSPTRRRAFTHLWTGARTLAIDTVTHEVVGNWESGCADGDTQGIDLDDARGVVLVGCADGTITALSAVDGKLLGQTSVATGVDIIAFSPTLHHLYVPSGSGKLAMIGVGVDGSLKLLETVATTARGAHCAAVDRLGVAWVCDPIHGRVVPVADGNPAS
jgi:YVTN family beta-propeller protein